MRVLYKGFKEPFGFALTRKNLVVYLKYPTKYLFKFKNFEI